MLGAFPYRIHRHAGHSHAMHVTVESALWTTGALVATLLIVVVLLFAVFGSPAF